VTTNEIGVRVVYRDKERRPTYTKMYTLAEYTEMLRTDLMRVITDVEDLCYTVNGNKTKEDWTDETFSAFSRIKHKLLDKAGDVGRIPENLCEITKEPLSNFVARMINEGEMPDGEGSLGPEGRHQGLE